MREFIEIFWSPKRIGNALHGFAFVFVRLFVWTIGVAIVLNVVAALMRAKGWR